jgi:hypothetical protein
LADPILDEVNLTTLKEIYPDSIEDNLFLDSPFLAHLRRKSLVPFTGGAFMQTVFIYGPLIGGAYTRGSNFNINKPQTLSGTLFDPKYYQVSVVEYKEDIQVLNRGDLSVFRLIDIDMQNAIQTISAILATDLNRNGQIAPRTPNINGWPEAINDGIVPSWDGNIYTSYGTQLRNGVVGAALNGNVFWAGTSLGAAAPIQYATLEEAYQTATIGREEPDLGVCNKALIAFIKERIQPQQRFGQERDPYYGAHGMRMNAALILKDDYFPSSRFGKNQVGIGNWLTGTIVYIAPATPPNNFPAGNVTLVVGEVFMWYNTRKWLLRLADDPEFGLGFSGFVPAQDNTRVAGQVKAAINVECTSPRLNCQIYGING